MKFLTDDFETMLSDFYGIPKDDRGYIYMVFDSAYPRFIKVGKTINPMKRLMAYNSDKPYNSSRYLCISKVFKESTKVEKAILEKLYEEFNSTTQKKEWFDIEAKEKIIYWIQRAEEFFETTTIQLDIEEEE